MVEQYVRATEHIVSLPVFLYNPVAVLFGHSIRAVRMKRRVLILRNFLHLAEKLGSRCLIHAAGVGKPTLTDSLQDAKHTRCIHIAGKLRRIKTDLHVALRRKVIHLCRSHLVHYLYEAHRVTQIRIMQMKMRQPFLMGDTFTVIYR